MAADHAVVVLDRGSADGPAGQAAVVDPGDWLGELVGVAADGQRGRADPRVAYSGVGVVVELTHDAAVDGPDVVTASARSTSPGRALVRPER